MSTTPDTSTTAGKIAVMQAFAEGSKVDYQPKGKDYWANASTPIWDWDNFNYRIAAPAFQWPNGYTPHNPANVDSAGEGWRFLSTLEINQFVRDQLIPKKFQIYGTESDIWRTTKLNLHKDFTYRVPVYHPFPVLPEPIPEAPKPAEATPDVLAGTLPFDLEKALAGAEIITRSGDKALLVLYIEEVEGPFKVLASVRGCSGIQQFLTNGCYLESQERHDRDLFLLAPKPKPKTETRWVNFYGTSFYSSQEEANAIAKEYGTSNRIACVEVTFTHGEGL